ncbi:MAG: ATP-binding cassette domain-containing protein [Lachnospiraceae bacterium]|nr:ATP-binding cassette domain-containing protein [Lachnospiraceae bacterium]
MIARTRTVYQAQIAECGAAALGMILAYHGCHVPLEQLRIDTGITRDGCNACHILEGAEKYGLKGRGRRLGASQLSHVQMPCILHWQQNHFVVLEGFSGREACINDPQRGRLRIPMDRFNRDYSGVVLLFEKTERFTQIPGRDSLLQAFLTRIKEQPAAAAATVFAHLLSVEFFLLFLLAVRTGIDQMRTGTISGRVHLMLLILPAALLMLGYLRGVFTEKLRTEADVLGVRDLVRRFLHLPDLFYEQRFLGDLFLRTDSVLQVNRFFCGELLLLPGTVLLSLSCLAAAFALSLPITLLVLLFLVIFLFILALLLRKCRDSAEKWTVEGGQLAGAAVNAFSVTGTIKTAGLEQEATAELTAAEEKCGDLRAEMKRREELARLAGVLLLAACVIVCAAVGSTLPGGSGITAGTLVVLPVLYAAAALSAARLPSFLTSLRRASAQFSRVEDTGVISEETTDRAEAEAFHGKLSGALCARDITGGYGRLQGLIVSGISLEAESGKRIAIIGASGSGKSTLLKILSGAMDPWEGTLLFDGRERREILDNILHASMATVQQEVVLFGGTIRDNLTLWNQNIMEEDVLRAARDAQIHDVILEKKSGYDHVLSENGSNFSGGERQCLEIARALAGNPSILFLDEATSRMDAATEKEVLRAVRRRGCTCVMVSHRPEAVRSCDEILVLQNGRVAARGRHEELVKDCGIYRELMGFEQGGSHA